METNVNKKVELPAKFGTSDYFMYRQDTLTMLNAFYLLTINFVQVIFLFS